MKQELHRSITFWSGLLLIGFICWAWWNSERFTLDAQYDRAKWSHCVSGIIFEHATILILASLAAQEGPNTSRSITFRRLTSPEGRGPRRHSS
jgi:hypothetical protein